LIFECLPWVSQPISKPLPQKLADFFSQTLPTATKGYKPSWLAWLCQWWSRSPGVSSTAATLQKPPSLRNNNGSLQVRVRIDGRDAFINRLGRWDDPVAVAKAPAIAAQIWSNYQQGSFDRSLMAYQPLIGGKEVGLLQRYGKPVRTRSDADAFLLWLREERGLSDCTIAGLMTHYRQCSGGNLMWKRRCWLRCRRGIGLFETCNILFCM
jgi:hypothetical protein